MDIMFIALGIFLLILLTIFFWPSSIMYITSLDSINNQNVWSNMHLQPSGIHTLKRSQINKSILYDSNSFNNYIGVVLPLATTLNVGDYYEISLAQQLNSGGSYFKYLTIFENSNDFSNGSFNSNHFNIGSNGSYIAKALVTKRNGIKVWTTSAFRNT
jgi:hypothetical protein